MTSRIIGFSDADAWERRGNLIVGRARDASYKEKLRSGIPIEYFIDQKDQEQLENQRVSEPVTLVTSHPVRLTEDKYYYSSDIFAEPDPLRSHRKISRHRKLPKYETKPKNSIKQSRGMVRRLENTPDIVKEENRWIELCDIVTDNIWNEIRFSLIRYRYYDCESIIHRFRSRLDQSIHTTLELIKKEWEKTKAIICADFTPLTTDFHAPRYFNGSFYEDWDIDYDDDDEETIYRPLYLYL